MSAALPRKVSAAALANVRRYSGLPPDCSTARRTAAASAPSTAVDSRQADSLWDSGPRLTTSAARWARRSGPSRCTPTTSNGNRRISAATRSSRRSVASSAHWRSSRTSTDPLAEASASSTAVSAAKIAAADSSAELCSRCAVPATRALTASRGPGRSRTARTHGHSAGIPTSVTAAPQPTGVPSATSSSTRRVLPIPAGPVTSTRWPAPARASASRRRSRPSSARRPMSESAEVTPAVSPMQWPLAYQH